MPAKELSLSMEDQKMVHFDTGSDPPTPRATKQIQFHIDRLNGLPAGSTIVVENTTSKQHLHRTTTNKGKKSKSGNIIVWEANLRQ
jgi:hypothetical protein